ncbi:Zn-ribbon domain-containing OB-fold protein [Diaphorobacter sp. HDW4A]|uniref:Zn-ribbon domain-containing OB-fold protein n=1 Tax=Diaphorobacter sp. HDW4A TaxID=2714924 RepID=UPI001F117600|nr:Zn-ribbon domain-containing OB-fold protein [Diaphorobacter sp. HDW4A]
MSLNMTTNYPLPRANAQTKAYWDGCAQGELRYQRCANCGHVQCIPRSLCDQCQSSDLQWNASRREGTVLTFTTVHRAPLPVFKDMVPYVIAIVDLDEGFRVMANALPAVQQGALEIGSRVRIGFKDVQGMALPIVEAILETSK